MTRREFVPTATAAVLRRTSRARLVLPVIQLIDTRAKLKPEQLHEFKSRVWDQAVRDLEACGIQIEGDRRSCEIRRSPAGRPLFTGLERGVINFVMTDQIPLAWDRGRGLTGVTALYRGYHLCLIALERAHGHQVPFLSVNSCLHELLHALLHDIFETRPSGFRGQAREFRVDFVATRLWLFRDCLSIRTAAEAYVNRLRADANRHTETI